MKKLRIEPLTRVEGHGRVDLEIEAGRLHGARVAITESPRFFEAMVLGRAATEVPALVCRICAICSAAHRIAASRALEKAWNIRLPRAVAKIRQLLLLGGHIESHALHLFCLILPDLEGAESVLELLQSGNQTARRGLELKRLGNLLQEVAGGRAIHPVNVEVGGAVFFPHRDLLRKLEDELHLWERGISDLLACFQDAANYPPARTAVGIPLSLLPEGALTLVGETLSLAGKSVAGAKYHTLLAETPMGYSNALRSSCQGKPLLTGALARQENARIAGILSEDPASPPGIHNNNSAQAIELSLAIREARHLVQDLLSLGKDEPLAASFHSGPGSGTGLVEAPRGLLIHHYELDDFGRIARADIVTPTAINQAAMEGQLMADLDSPVDENLMVGYAERIIRAYDPCISCSVHLIRRKH